MARFTLDDLAMGTMVRAAYPSQSEDTEQSKPKKKKKCKDYTEDDIREIVENATSGKKKQKAPNPEKEAAKAAKRQREEEQRAMEEMAAFHDEVMYMVPRRKYLTHKLSKLSPYKKKHIRKIAEINAELEYIDAAMAQYKKITGRKPSSPKYETKKERFVRDFKEKKKSFGKKVKKFFRKYADVLDTIGGIVVPIFGAMFLGKFASSGSK